MFEGRGSVNLLYTISSLHRLRHLRRLLSNILVQDLYQPMIAPKVDGDKRGLVWISHRVCEGTISRVLRYFICDCLIPEGFAL